MKNIPRNDNSVNPQLNKSNYQEGERFDLSYLVHGVILWKKITRLFMEDFN